MPLIPPSTIDVRISPAEISFDGNDGYRAAFAPIVHIRPAKPGSRPAFTDIPVAVGIGNEVPRHEESIPVPLFSAGSAMIEGYLKGACLAAFFRSAFRGILERHVFRVRPVVRVHGANTLALNLCGYERTLLFEALGLAGAKQIDFIE